MKDPNELFQSILDSVSPLLEPEWIELVFDYHVDEGQSDLAGSYLTRSASGLEEVAIVSPPALDGLFRELRASLPGGSQRPFSHCKFRVSRGSGSFKADYSYDSVDWTELLTSSNWNFTEAPTKRVLQVGVGTK
ncbi:MAG TPA: hypothetical protein VN280_18455 [Variovorax sp.]|nr:hypothetical protein [Variovorax sp.]